MTDYAGLFITGTDTDVGKTIVGGAIARHWLAQGARAGVYKPVASGCESLAGEYQSSDAISLWEAAGRPARWQDVCPQRFLAPLAPPIAARLENRHVDWGEIERGLEFWRQRSSHVLVEGAGGLLSPLTDDQLVADLAAHCGYPLVIVARDALGTINHTLLTVEAALARSLSVAAIVLSATQAEGDASRATNAAEIARRVAVPVVRLTHGATEWQPDFDWLAACG